MLNTTGARLAAALLGYIALVIVLLTLNPFYLELPARLRVSLRLVPRDILQNVILFLPLGYLYRLTGGRRRGAILLGAALSAGVEAVQLVIPVRAPSPVDIVTNTLGAGAGAWLYERLAARIAMTPAMVGRLALETPLMGLVYLLVPLLWVNALALAAAPGRWPLTALIGAGGAIVLSEIARAWRGPAGPGGAARAALAGAAGGAWFLLGSGPGLLRPLPALPIAAGVALLTAALAALPLRRADRRFERATLGRALPALAIYLLLAALWPPLRPLGPWHGAIGLTDRVEPMGPPIPVALLEYLAAFTVLGYVGAEWRGRAELPLARDLPRLLPLALGGALALELLAGFQAGRGASLVRAALVVVGALLGAMIYHRQRDHVRFLLGRPPALSHSAPGPGPHSPPG